MYARQVSEDILIKYKIRISANFSKYILGPKLSIQCNKVDFLYFVLYMRGFRNFFQAGVRRLV